MTHLHFALIIIALVLGLLSALGAKPIQVDLWKLAWVILGTAVLLT